MYILTIAILPGTTTALGDTMLVVRESTGEVTIPVFDTGLGTLTAASLNVTLLASPISAAGPHQHMIDPPDVTISGQGQALNLPAFLSEPAGAHAHPIGISSIVIGTKTLAAVNISTSVASDHQHMVDFPAVPGSYDSFADRTRYDLPTILSDPASAHSHGHPTLAQSEVFGAGELAVFLAAADFGVPRLTALSAVGPHQHLIDPPTFAVPLVGGGSASVDIPAFLSDAAGGHGHSLSAVWRTEATFTFEPIPEPASAALAAIGLVGLAVFCWKRAAPWRAVPRLTHVSSTDLSLHRRPKSS